MCRKIVRKNSEWQEMAVPNFFLTIFSKTTGINSEWPKITVPNFF